jgi:5-methylthioadenosine/S-adenosylhomocysteine deaminase
MLAPHAPYTCSEGYQRTVAQEAKRLGLPINPHLSEGPVETETIRSKYGCSPVELLDKTGLLTDRTLAAHCVQVSDSDIAILAERGVCVATNPISNLKPLNMFRELTMLSLIHKGVNHDALAVTACEGFSIATKGGAAAMGRSDIGEIIPGNTADLAIIDLSLPNLQPVNNPVSALAYSAYGSEVETVMVGGRILMENREFLTIDSDRVIYEVSGICKRIGI